VHHLFLLNFRWLLDIHFTFERFPLISCRRVDRHFSWLRSAPPRSYLILYYTVNQTADWMKKILAEDEITLETFRTKQKVSGLNTVLPFLLVFCSKFKGLITSCIQSVSEDYGTCSGGATVQ